MLIIFEELSQDAFSLSLSLSLSVSLPPLEEKVDEVGPLEPDREDIRRDPLSLPEHFVWDDIDLLDDAQVAV